MRLNVTLRNFFLSLMLVFLGDAAFGQADTSKLTKEDLNYLQKYEDTLSAYSEVLLLSKKQEDRIFSAMQMIKRLVMALEAENSYYYPFDSVKAFSVLYSPDNKFRVITWQLEFDNKTYRHYGAIQLKGKEMKLIPFWDGSDEIENLDTILNNKEWYGAYYYNMIKRAHKDKDYYYLFGLDPSNPLSTKKVLEVMHFNEDGKSVTFGAPHFVFETDSGTYVYNRVILEFAKSGGVSLNYFDEFGKIIYDHLVPRNELSIGVYSTYISDGSYEGFDYDQKTGEWIHIEKVFDQTFDEPPIPNPVDFSKEKEMDYKKRKEPEQK